MKRPPRLLLLLVLASTTIFSIAISAAIKISDKSIHPSSNHSTSNQNAASATLSTGAGSFDTNHKQQQPTTARTRQTHNHQRRLQAKTTTTNQPGQRPSTKQPASSVSSSFNLPPLTSGSSSSSSFDPFALAQQQARIMMGYNNTPPLFVTATRDLFIDVRLPLGTKLTTMRAEDLDGDQLEYSLQPANFNDASTYFSIDPISGELRLANKQFQLYSSNSLNNYNQSSIEEHLGQSHVDNDHDDDNDNDDADNGSGSGELQKTNEHDLISGGGGDELIENNKNLYFLNVAADDGKYTSVVELRVHVGPIAGLTRTLNGAPLVQLTPTEGIKRTTERMENLMLLKTREFYNELNKVPTAATNPNSTIVYPDFINPSLIKPTQQLVDGPQLSGELIPPHPQIETTTVPIISPINGGELFSTQTQPISTTTKAAASHSSSSSSSSSSIAEQEHQQHIDALVPQPIVVSLVVFCSGLTIALVLLMFIIPLSVKRLRKRLKHVERQHEQLSQKTSHSSSTVCSSTASSMGTTSTNNAHNHHHHHNAHSSSFSQFTLSSDSRSCAINSSVEGCGNLSVCRQSSLDSMVMSQPQAPQTSAAPMMTATTTTTLNRPLNRVNNGSIANPVYLHQHQNHHQANLNSPVHQLNNTTSYLLQQQQGNHQHHLGQQQQQTTANNIYYPLDDTDEFYSTINTENTTLHKIVDPVDLQRIIETTGTVGLQTGIQKYYMDECAPPIPPRFESHQQVVGMERELTSIDVAAINRQSNEMEIDRCRRIGGVESPANSDSGSSTRSLARFLSLPLRAHPVKVQEQLRASEVSDSSCFIPNNNHFTHHTQQLVGASKTIARGYHINRGQTTTNNNNNNWELDRHKLKIFGDAMIGEGQFGLVFKGKLNQRTDNNKAKEELTVAVKMLNRNISRDVRGREEFLAEIEIMKLVSNHPNVVKMLHCCTVDAQPLLHFNEHSTTTTSSGGGNPILLIMEYAEQGNLQKLLEKSRLNHEYTTSSCYSNMTNDTNCQQQEEQQFNSNNNNNNDQSKAIMLTSRELLKFIYHIAKGMEYISSQCIVHRDLASRNILVNKQRICKIGDFGMARHMQSLSEVYERHSLNTKIPVRWMAPEVLLNNKFTTKSDVFSFGILMWEVVTLGSSPYTHLKTEQVIEKVARNGERPQRPEYCHPQLYEIMSKCWSHEPKNRPTFRSLVKQLDELLLSSNDYIELDQYPNHNYYNIPKTSAPYELL